MLIALHCTRTLSDDTVNIVVGNSKKVFKAHKGLLCKKVPFFLAALEGSFVEGQELKVNLPEMTPSVFQRFLLWCYQDRILDAEEDISSVTAYELVDLYIFGDFCGIPQLQNQAIDSIIDQQCATNTLLAPREVFEKTTETSPLRRLFVDLFASSFDWSAEKEKSESELEAGYTVKIMMEIASAKNKQSCKSLTDFKIFKRNYHVDAAGLKDS